MPRGAAALSALPAPPACPTMPDSHPPDPPTPRFKLAALSIVGAAMVALPLAQVLRYQDTELQAALAEQAGLEPAGGAAYSRSAHG